MLPTIYKYTLLFRDKINIIFYPDDMAISKIFEEIIKSPENISISYYTKSICNPRFYPPKDFYNIIFALNDIHESYTDWADYHFGRGEWPIGQANTFEILNQIKSQINTQLQAVSDTSQIIILIDHIDRYLDIYCLKLLLEYLSALPVYKILISASSYDLIYLNGKGTYIIGDQYKFSYDEYASFMQAESKKIFHIYEANKHDNKARINEKLSKLTDYTYSNDIQNWFMHNEDVLDILPSLKCILEKYITLRKLALELGVDDTSIYVCCYALDTSEVLNTQIHKFDNDEYMLNLPASIRNKLCIDFYACDSNITI